MSSRLPDSSDGAVSRSTRSRPDVRQHREEIIVCNPLKTLEDVAEFLNDPPVWRSLCIELRPHSEDAIQNLDIVEQNAGPDHEITLEQPETFCHFDADKGDVRRHRRKSLPKTLVCHDMANGYHDDCKIDGTGNHEAYTFYNWAAVDIFCYFSHHFITIPPLGWINVGHAHGVKVLGTVITEWGPGAALWDELLAEPAAWRGFAANLVAIAKTLKFDGWLLNVENKISKPLVLVEFVRYLRELLHSELADAELVWYDSVTITGALAWQNTLNHHNRAFFDACDGMFTNYSWSARQLCAARAAAGARRRDVYVGVDVWGRNFLGGGQFNTQEAVKLAHSYGLSLAIFAPAWTHEALPDTDVSLRTFLLRERALWSSLWPLLHTKLPSALPFSTSFCIGQGRRRRMYGEVLSPTPWYNIRHQQYQPNSAFGPHGYLLRLCQDQACRLSQPDEPEAQLQAMTISNEIQEEVKAKETDQPEMVESGKAPPENDYPEGNLPEEKMQADQSQSDEKTQGKEINQSEGAQSECIILPNSKPVVKRYQLISTDEESCLELCLEDSFTGGGCLLVNPAHPQLIRLFHCDFAIQDTLVACVVTKTLPALEDQYLNIILSVRDVHGTPGRVVLAAGPLLPGGGGGGGGGGARVRAAEGGEFVELQRYLLLQQPGFYVSVENAYGWKVRYYSVRLAGARVTAVSCSGSGPALLGQLGLCHRSENVD